MKIEPQSMSGPWKKGYSLAPHTTSSEFLGHDANGNPKFDTTRSEIGEAIYQIKYRDDRRPIDLLAGEAATFITSKGWPVDLIVSLPPSRARVFQPVAAIAKQVAAKLGIEYSSGALNKTKETPELKSLAELSAREEALKGAFKVDAAIVAGRTVLLFDDLYRSGASMREVTRVLLEEGKAAAVYVVALTRTRKNR